ncbi:MAG: alpha-glucuronidase [Chloroflexi bacterium]|nr:alpha-glucuronidase [Chloroflexota bacterium]
MIVGTVDELKTIDVSIPQNDCRNLGSDGFLIRSYSVIASDEGAKQSPTSDWGLLRAQNALAMTENNCILITANSAPAVLIGAFHFLRLLQTHQDIRVLDVTGRPRIRHRILAHWDNLDGSIERGYAGRSLWNWDELPKIDPRYHDYARACASIGINGTCLNNVNASATSLTTAYLEKTAALADVFRPYGIRVYLSPNFSAPMRLGGLTTSDPRDPGVAAWWQQKVDEIYRLIPDFGGFQVKANSEGQPGPQDNGANHDDGANMLADAFAPHGGIVLWRAFVYDTTVDADRANCANKEFVPLDGKFRANVVVQVKNGAIDFQPREPFHPLFGAAPRTALALELQITQEYLGQSKHLVYLGGMWQEVLDSDTYANGAGMTVAKIVSEPANSCVVGVANTGTERNWCGHHFSQANWYAFGRLTWDHTLSAGIIADEWIRMTWSNAPRVVDALKTMMLGSWEACINYMTPLGLHHLMQEGHHYGPDPGFDGAPRADWNSVYYHRADAHGLGFDRTRAGSNNVSQYHSPLREQFDNLDTCPEKFLLWFHHASWDHLLASGRTLWQELQQRYDAGVAFVETMRDAWQSLQPKIDPARHAHVAARLAHQLENAREWREVCLGYFSRFANLRFQPRVFGEGDNQTP